MHSLQFNDSSKLSIRRIYCDMCANLSQTWNQTFIDINQSINLDSYKKNKKKNNEVCIMYESEIYTPISLASIFLQYILFQSIVQ